MSTFQKCQCVKMSIPLSKLKLIPNVNVKLLKPMPNVKILKTPMPNVKISKPQCQISKRGLSGPYTRQPFLSETVSVSWECASHLEVCTGRLAVCSLWWQAASQNFLGITCLQSNAKSLGCCSTVPDTIQIIEISDSDNIHNA